MDTFGIGTSIRILLVTRLLGSLAIAGISIWAVTDGGLDFEKPALGWAVSGVLILYGLYNVVRLVGLSQHEVGISETQVRVGSTTLDWEQVESATIRPAFQMDTAIELKHSGGEPLQIKAATRSLAFILSAVKKHVKQIDEPS